MRRFAAHRKAVSAAVWIALLATVALCQTPSEVTRELEPGFQDRAMAHVRHLAAFGERVAGGEGEAKALAYIRSQMVEMGLEVVVEPFEFQSFVLESAGITAGSNYAEVIRLGFNPYAGGDRRAGELAFVESTDSVGALQKTDLDDKIVVTTPNGNLYVLSMFHRPRAIVSVSATDFQRLQAAGLRSGEVTFRGKITKLRSANIVGTLPSAPSTGRVIILSAHYDSWRGPGANDNASGVAALLELARHFRSRKPVPAAPMRFVAFGAEELGMLGAKAYLAKHRAELQNWQLLFNMDTIGGNGDIYTDTRPNRQSIATEAPSHSPTEPPDEATSDIDHRWLLIGAGQSAMFSTSTVPESLRTAVFAAGKELGVEIHSSSGMGSDHRVFFQAGVVATDIAISGSGLHTNADVPESVNARALETAARVVTVVVEKALHP